MPRLTALTNIDTRRQWRVLMISYGSLGEVLSASPLPAMLKSLLPNSTITWLADAGGTPFAQAFAGVDEVITLDDMPRWENMVAEWKLPTLWRELSALKKTWQSRRFDIVIDCRGDFISRAVAYFSAAERRVGFDAPGICARKCLTDRVSEPGCVTRFTQRPRALLSPFGITTADASPSLIITPADYAAARSFLSVGGMADDEPYIACVVSGDDQRAEWAWSRWAALADQLWERMKIRCVFVGGSQRRVDTMRVVESSMAKPISSVGNLPPIQAASIVQQARVVVGTDTGLTFVGLSTHRPVIVLCGPTDPMRLAEEAGIDFCFHPSPCSPCQPGSECQTAECMQVITVDEVAAAVMQALNKEISPAWAAVTPPAAPTT